MNIEWWYWIIAGILLILLELVIPSFFVLWFGLGALLVGGLLLLNGELGLTGQLLIWLGASLAMVVLWLRVFRSSRQKTLIGTAAGEVMGEIGLLVGAVAPFQRGRVRFQKPILGAEEWACVADSAIAAGARVRIVSIEGSYLKVAPQ
ncbi:NfeD family protein [Pseudomonas sp. NW5]|uniref:NfeD family protein n=1 Tax=Pseudomonas sp. NW5 TaxID=2934934 RepID=UPI00201FE046|nr:NfeD family protein [Pseudomonas sp. NW5]MCL7462496.1 NfeD family protein [Pseudomonas sp. NW5]